MNFDPANYSWKDLLAGAQVKPIQISTIERTDALRGVRANGTHNHALIDSLARALKEGEVEWRDIEPIDVVRLGEQRYLLADGYHRVAALEAALVKTVRARIVDGDEWDAAVIAGGRIIEIDESVKTPTSEADRDASVMTLVNMKPDISNREVGRLLNLSHRTVGKIRKRLGIPSDHVSPKPPEVKKDPDDDIFDFDDTPASEEVEEPPFVPNTEPEWYGVKGREEGESKGLGFGVDLYGEPFPSAECRDAVEKGAARFREMLINHLDNAARGLGQLADDRVSAHLNQKKLMDLIRQCREYAKAGIPHAVYVFDPNTEPTTPTDRVAREVGFVTKSQYESMNRHARE